MLDIVHHAGRKGHGEPGSKAGDLLPGLGCSAYRLALREQPRQQAHGLEEFEFFQAVRLLARLFPQRKPVGGTAKPGEEIARFGARLSMAFPPSVVHDIEHIPDSPEPARVTVAFLALTGTQGVLPFAY